MDLEKNQIIAVIIVVVLGVSVGMAFQAFSASKYSYTVLNQTNTSTNSSNQTQQTINQSSNNTNIISAAEAISIARNRHPEWSNYRAEPVYSDNAKRYDVRFYNNQSAEMGDVIIDATNGEVIVPGL